MARAHFWCVPGGPGQAVEYLGELGGLSDHRTLVLLDNRGTGASQAPEDPGTYRVDRLVRDVEALRVHLGLDQIDLFGHSASGGICLLYAAEHRDRLDRLVLVDPSLRVVGIPSDRDVEKVLARRAHEPWHADAVAALFDDADMVGLPRAGHFPWVDDPAGFVAAVEEFLARPT